MKLFESPTEYHIFIQYSYKCGQNCFLKKLGYWDLRVATNVFGRIAIVLIGVATILVFLQQIAADCDCDHIIRPPVKS